MIRSAFRECPPAERDSFSGFAPTRAHTHVFMCTNTVSCSHIQYTQPTALLRDWFSRASDRSLWQIAGWQPNTKKAHTLTPNLWGGLGGKGGGWPSSRPPQLSPSYHLFILSLPFSAPVWITYFARLSPLWLVFRLSFLLFYLFSATSAPSSVSLQGIPSLPLSLAALRGVIDSPSVHLSWKQRRRRCDVIHLAGDGGSAASLITGPINLTHRGRISTAVRQQTHMACLNG